MALKVVKRPESPYYWITGRAHGYRINRSTKTRDRGRAEGFRAAVEAELYDQVVLGKTRRGTFADAYDLYVELGGERRFADKLREYFQDTPIDEITQERAMDCARALYNGAANSTIKRQVYIPLKAIIGCYKAAYPERCTMHKLTAPRVADSELDYPPDEWIDEFVSQAPPHLAALIMFLTTTGVRVSEALRVEWGDIDRDREMALIRRTKNGEAREVPIAPRVTFFLNASKKKKPFGYAGRAGALKAIKAICKRAGLRYYGTHQIGRHAFAARMLKKGYSLKSVQRAGGWKTITQVSRYAHLERDDVHNAMRDAAEWGNDTQPEGQGYVDRKSAI